MTIPVSTLTVAEPQVCPTCGGDREITGIPCPACCCYACGDPTDTPPVCRGCGEGVVDARDRVYE